MIIPGSRLPAAIAAGQPVTALAPMQDVTDLPFMRVIAHYGAPDYFFTEFFRVHSQSRPERHILRSIVENATGRPVFAQLIGEHIPDMVRTVRELLAYPIAGIDLNLGCPAPKIYKKNVGGGLLRDPAKVDELLGALRDAVPGLFTVKMRIGFDSTEHFGRILELVNRHAVDLLSVHGRTVKEMYRSEVHFDYVALAARTVRCPVLANGNVTSAARGVEILRETGAAGLMIGRHAIRNPWIFRQCREALAGRRPAPVRLAEVREYIDRLYGETRAPGIPEHAHVAKMKKYLNFVGQSVDPAGAFLHDMRRAHTEAELFAVCDRHLLSAPDREFSPEPHAGVIARPNCETPVESCSLDAVGA
ncbi:MAG TPA: tRNA-dihydrouridine synthase family protein [Lacunisphaera sp.]|jgi:tRNA-dihydrouridine synthase|nr:tRNA-dihydrouridine synthase family protein [Lacunisphaera sp.]